MYSVVIDLQRVQTFLFAVPRLRDMVGANVLLGEILRNKLTRLALEYIGNAPPWPDGVDIAGLNLPGSLPDDPLANAQGDLRDDPSELYSKGILARDGGHFRAVFTDRENADLFCDAADQLLMESLPGLRFSMDLTQLGNRTNLRAKPEAERALVDLPQFQVCEESGSGPAEKQDHAGTEDATWISRTVVLRRDAANRFNNAGSGTTNDVVGLIRKQMPAFKRPAKDFKELCGGDYLAVIHADGNGIGKRSSLARGAAPDSPLPIQKFLEREVEGERFFHSMRVTVRKALLRALQQTFGNREADYWQVCQPYQILMLGGDDILLVCRAKSALGFVVAYANALTSELPSDGRPLTIGAGVVIAAPTLPFYRLHQLAEMLATSAKRLYRGLQQRGREVSVVDWIVNTGSWVEDPISQRQQSNLVRYEIGGKIETLALTRRPVPILRSEGEEPDLASLEGLINAIKALESLPPDALPRSQRRRLVDELPRGRLWSTEIFKDLRVEILNHFKTLGLPEPWLPIGDRRWVTPLVDLVELLEIKHLATKS